MLGTALLDVLIQVIQALLTGTALAFLDFCRSLTELVKIPADDSRNDSSLR